MFARKGVTSRDRLRRALVCRERQPMAERYLELPEACIPASCVIFVLGLSVVLGCGYPINIGIDKASLF